MKVLSNDVKSLLDKIYNLRGEDSVILAKMTRDREAAIETQERTKNEKEILLKEIDHLTNEEKILAEEGKKLTSLLANINKDDFSMVLERLNIDFDPDAISEKVNALLPETIAKVTNENQKATEKLKNIEIEMQNAITKVEELGIRKEEALNAQSKLNEYISLALSGNINITRDAITSLLEKFDFNENEQREAAKLLMFPEDALYEYDASYKSGDQATGKTITEVLAEAKKESNKELESVDAKNDIAEVKESANKESVLEEIFDKVIEENTIADSVEINENDKSIDKEKLLEALKDLGLNSDELKAEDIEKLLNNYDLDLFKSNLDELKNKEINIGILKNNIELLYDKELNAKISKLLELGKEARDISLMPNVLVKYDLEGLNNTINVIKISGLDPRKVPLIAY